MATHTTTAAAATAAGTRPIRSARTALDAASRATTSSWGPRRTDRQDLRRGHGRGPRGWNTQHDVAPTSLNSAMLSQLCRTWVSTHQSAHARDLVEHWSIEHPALAGCTSPGDIVDLTADSDADGRDQILRSLLELAQAGQTLAGEILIQTMLPVLSKMPATMRPVPGEDYEAALQRVLSAFWEVIVEARELPRPGVAGRLQMDTLHRATAHRRGAEARWSENLFIGHLDSFEEWTISPGDEHSPTTGQTPDPALVELDPEQSDLVDVLRWMRDSGEFTNDDARFLGEVFLVDGGDQKAAAHRLGLSHAAARQRVSRLRTKLCTAVAAEAAAAGIDALPIAS